MCGFLLGTLKVERPCRQRAWCKQKPRGPEHLRGGGKIQGSLDRSACVWSRPPHGMRGGGAAEAGREEIGRGLKCFIKECGLDLPVWGLPDLGL